MSSPRSLGWRSDLIFFQGERADGWVEQASDHWVIRTPSNPTYHWGNFLLFREAPRSGDGARWGDLFAKAFVDQPQSTHRSFGWDVVDAELGAALTEFPGFALQETCVLTAATLEDPGVGELEVRELREEEEWQQAIDNQVATRDMSFGEEDYRRFKQRQFAMYRGLAKVGRGAWFGAFLRGELVGDLGVFRDGAGVGRFQQVETLPEHRRRGVARALVYAAGISNLAREDVQQLVIIADANDAPRRVYEAVGFREVERQVALGYWEGMPAPESGSTP